MELAVEFAGRRRAVSRDVVAPVSIARAAARLPSSPDQAKEYVRWNAQPRPYGRSRLSPAHHVRRSHHGGGRCPGKDVLVQPARHMTGRS